MFAAPPAAPAGTISLTTVTTDGKNYTEEPVLSFQAAPGEQNRIVVTRTGAQRPPTVTLHDAGAPVRPGPGCTAVDARTVSCALYYVSIDAGDGDDTVTLQPAGADALSGAALLSGGSGNDVLTCPEPCGGSRLAGGPGDDLLRGGSADDVLSGDGDGPIALNIINPLLTEPAGAGNDSLDGGPGHDQLNFSGRRGAVRVDLAAGTATGAGGEHDRLAGLEDVTGGDGDDLLLGDANDNRIEGGVGDDRLGGRAGHDDLLGDIGMQEDGHYVFSYTQGPRGADTLHGGAGDDRLHAGNESGDELSGGPGADLLENGGAPARARKVRCGSGRDTVTFGPQGQLLSDCELLRSENDAMRISLQPQRRAGGRLRFVWACQQTQGCVMGIGVRAGAAKLARRRLSLDDGDRSPFVMRPAKAARRGRAVEVTIVVPISGSQRPYSARWRVVP